MFSAPTYAFETPAGRAARGTAVPLGAVLARDPDSDPVTYSLTAGDWTRFTVEPSSGAITYLGPDLPGTRRYELQVTARDTGRLTQTATVMVTVASATVTVTRPTAVAPASHRPRRAPRQRLQSPQPGGAPQRAAPSPRRRAPQRAAQPPPTRRTAVADAARTYAGLPVLIDVLANDADLDGARIVAVTAPAHGTTTVADGMVRYAPAAGHRGRDTFTYTVVLDAGHMARATVTVMVVG